MSVLGLPVPTVNAVARFLLDRLDEDDDKLDRRSRTEPAAAALTYCDEICSSERLRLEIISKRHVIRELQLLLVLRDLPGEQPVREVAQAALCAYAATYQGHHKYRPEWRLPTPELAY